MAPWEEKGACFLISQTSPIQGEALTFFNCSKDWSRVALRKSLMPEPSFHFSGFRSSVE